MALITETQAYVRQNIKVMSKEEVVRVCVDLDFDTAAIKKHLAKYETNDKYKGLQQFEWATATSRKDKAEKMKELAEKRQRQAEWK